MLPEILTRNLRVLFVGTTVSQASSDLGFYYLGPNNRFWGLLEYAGITSGSIVTPHERKILVDTFKTQALSEMYKTLFFEKKEAELAKYRIGLTDLNRRRTFSSDDDPAAKPTADDMKKFITKVEKYRPQIVAFVAGLEIFEQCLKPLYPSATRTRGKQAFTIGGSEVWLLGSTSGRVKDTEALEQVFEELEARIKLIPL